MKSELPNGMVKWAGSQQIKTFGMQATISFSIRSGA